MPTHVFACALCAALSAACLAAPPANDSRLAPLHVETTDPTPVDLFEATTDAGDPLLTCTEFAEEEDVAGLRGHGTVWLSFQAKRPTAFITTRTTRLPHPDAIFAVFDHSGVELVQIACKEAGVYSEDDPFQMCVSGLEVGRTYLLEIAVLIPTSQFLSVEILEECLGEPSAPCYTPQGACVLVTKTACEAARGIFDRHGAGCFLDCCEVPIVNDGCANAIDVPLLPATVAADTLCASNHPALQWFGATDLVAKEVWYRVTGSGRTIRVSTCSPVTRFQSSIAVLCGTCESPDLLGLAHQDSACEYGALEGATFSWCAEMGRSYFVVVGGFGGPYEAGATEVVFSDDGECGTPSRCCRADVNGGGLSVQDTFDFLSFYFAGDLRADFNRSGLVTVQDIFDFLDAYFTGC